jgi:hypothetical protein
MFREFLISTGTFAFCADHCQSNVYYYSDIPRQNSEYGADNRTFKDFPTAFSGSICNDVFEDPTESSPSPVVDFNGQQMDEKSVLHTTHFAI